MTKSFEKSAKVNQANEVGSFETLDNFFLEQANELPHGDIDKQILAAAERELASPKARSLVYSSWWKRFLLPLYGITTLAFTAIAAHWLWPEPVMVPPGTGKGPTIINVVTQEDEVRLDSLRGVDKKRTPQSLPSIKTPVAPPDEDSVKVPIMERMTDLKSLQKEQVQAIKTMPISRQQVNRLSHPDKEIWVRQIIQLLKQGDYALAQKELVLFKKSHPDYPIDEQIEPFRH